MKGVVESHRASRIATSLSACSSRNEAFDAQYIDTREMLPLPLFTPLTINKAQTQ